MINKSKKFVIFDQRVANIKTISFDKKFYQLIMAVLKDLYYVLIIKI